MILCNIYFSLVLDFLLHVTKRITFNWCDSSTDFHTLFSWDEIVIISLTATIHELLTLTTFCIVGVAKKVTKTWSCILLLQARLFWTSCKNQFYVIWYDYNKVLMPRKKKKRLKVKTFIWLNYNTFQEYQSKKLL